MNCRLLMVSRLIDNHRPQHRLVLADEVGFLDGQGGEVDVNDSRVLSARRQLARLSLYSCVPH